MKTLFKWLVKYKGALYISGGYGVAAVLLYVLGLLSGGDGPTGAWYLIYYSALPISYLFGVPVALLGDFLPDKLFGLLYSTSPIIAGMIWYYLISRCVLAVRARMRACR